MKKVSSKSAKFFAKKNGFHCIQTNPFHSSTPKISLELVSDDHFAVKVKNVTISEKLKRLIYSFGGFYHHEKKHWLIQKTLYSQTLEELNKLSVEEKFMVDSVPHFVLKAFEGNSPFENTKDHPVSFDYREDKLNYDLEKELPEKLYKALYNFQLKGITYALEHHGRVLIGDEMGVGKTVQALSVSYVYRDYWPLLILAPSSLRFVWRDEIRRWLPMIPKYQISVIENSKTAFGYGTATTKIFIMSYDLAKNVEAKLHKMKFKIAIADEVHYLKSRDAKRSKILGPLLAECTRVILVSGTPMLARPQEVFNIIHILRPDLFPKFFKFGNRYCNPYHGSFGMDWGGCEHPEELHYLLSQTLMIRRLKEEVLSELPKKRRQRISIEADPKVIKKISALMSKYDQKALVNKIEELQETTEEQQEPGNAKFDIMTVYNLTGEAKIPGILEFISTLIENEIKFIFFGFHISVLNAVEAFLKKHKVYNIRIDGSTALGKRHLMVREFQLNPRCKAALLGITASSQGITLTAASTVVFGELAWTPGILEQAEDRAHRINQKESVNVYYLMAEHTLDSLIFRILKTKNENITRTLDGKGADYDIEIKDKEKIIMETTKKIDNFPSGTLESYSRRNNAKKIQPSPPKKSKNPIFIHLSEKEQTEIMNIFSMESETKISKDQVKLSSKREPNFLERIPSPPNKIIKDSQLLFFDIEQLC